MNREELSAYLEAQGAVMRGSVTSKTDLLIVGFDPGSNKVEAAHDKGVPTLWYPIVVAIGLLEEREGKRWLTIPDDLLAQLIVNMATITEDLYVKSIDSGDDRWYRAYVYARNALSAVLVYAYGTVRAAAEERHDDSTRDP